MMPDAPTKKQHRCLEQDMHSDTTTFGKNLTLQQHNPQAPKVPRCDRLAASDTVKSVRLVQLSWGGAGQCRPSRPPKLFTGLWVICSFCRSAQHHHTGPFDPQHRLQLASTSANKAQLGPTWLQLLDLFGSKMAQYGRKLDQFVSNFGPNSGQHRLSMGDMVAAIRKILKTPVFTGIFRVFLLSTVLRLK